MTVGAGTYPLRLEQGRTWRRVFTVKDAGGSLINLTGWHAHLVVRRQPFDPTNLLDLSDGAGITLGGAGGTMTVEITAAQSAGLPSGSLVHEVQVTEPNGDVSTLLAGVAVVVPWPVSP